MRVYYEQPLTRVLGHVSGISRPTLITWLKKDRDLWHGSSPLAKVQETLVPVQDGDVLELDELWSYVGSKKNPIWLWIAVRNKIPPAYKTGLIFTDFWKAQQLPLTTGCARQAALRL